MVGDEGEREVVVLLVHVREQRSGATNGGHRLGQYWLAGLGLPCGSTGAANPCRSPVNAIRSFPSPTGELSGGLWPSASR
ncbi:MULTISPECIES: hypothetical protein [Kribbella]|uniref:hypothetical protein n=1 Tax=Kribbella TaxID=182639 RepID=UPI001046CB97|nr:MULTISPECIES: hypothetical protein [Kribbella]